MTARFVVLVIACSCAIAPSVEPLRAVAPELVVAGPAVPPTPRPTASLLRDLAVTDDHFHRRILYSWTTAASIAALRSTHQLLVATATSGTFVSPFNRALAAIAARRGSGQAIAQLLATHPALIRRRYAWPAPFATVLGAGPRSYGHALIRIELRPEAWIGRFEPAARDPFHFIDATGAVVPLDRVLAHPERIAAVFHVRTEPVMAPRFREYVVCNAAMVARWSVATPAIRAEVSREVALIAALRDRWSALAAADVATPAVSAWDRASARSTTVELWRAALAFDSARYRPERPALDAIDAALAAYDESGPALEVAPRP